MDEESIFALGPEQLDRLLSIGTGDDLQQEEKQEAENRSAQANTTLSEIVEQPGGWIDRYQLLSILGEGGMGIVYLAEQEEPIKRQVALKVIKPGMDSERVIARFEAEKQALAVLDHPNIARIFDAGTTELGRPYFVMEYVEGKPITDYCDQHRLTIEDRLRLFVQICRAVQHAHQKGIIHRDIKPSNILVSLQADRAASKIIDFGVAKALAQPLTERTLVTEQNQLFGTPEYMSPEQADMVNVDIDTRSDIYSLGVLLYVLLTGVLPFDSTTFREGGIEHIRKMIRETDPKTPSTQLTKLGSQAKAVAENRRTEVNTLTKRLYKELGWIPLKAMRKERAERYQSASELAVDVENYLSGAALIAGPPSTVYKLKKFVRRNRALVSGIMAVFIVLVAGVVTSTVFAIRAEQKARIAEAISDFFRNDVFESIDPLSGDQPGQSFVDIATQRLDGKFEDEPLVEASIRYTLGRRYWHIGKFDAAEKNLKCAVELGRKTLGKRDLELLNYMQELAFVYFWQSRYDEAEPLLVEAFDRMRKMLSETDPLLQRTTTRLAWLFHMQGKNQKAEKLWTDLLEAMDRHLGHDHIDATGHMKGLACVYKVQGRLVEAEKLSRKALDITRRVHGEGHLSTLGYMESLASVCRAQGNYAEAEELFIKVLKGRRRLLGEEHFLTLGDMRHLGSLYLELKRYEEAEQLLVPALETNRRLYGNEIASTYRLIDLVAKLYREQNHYEKAESLFLEAEDIARQLFGDNHVSTKESVQNLITLYEAWDKPEEAEEWRARGRRRNIRD